MINFPFLKSNEDVWGWARRLVTELNNFVKTGALPTGSLVESELTVAPPGWLLADGASYTSSDYPALYLALGGTGGTFSVPSYSPAYGQTVMIKD